MATAVSICNQALFHLGINRSITEFTDASDEARACNLFYDPDRKHVLAEFPWNFAKKYETLSLVSGGDPQGFSYAYQLPADLITARKIFQSSPGLGDIDFMVVGQELWTNQEDAVLEYTHNVETVNFFSPLFITALSHKIASDLAMPLTRKQKLEQKESVAYFGFISSAATGNAREGLDTTEKTDDFLASREG